jgi:hypothetical protein
MRWPKEWPGVRTPCGFDREIVDVKPGKSRPLWIRRLSDGQWEMFPVDRRSLKWLTPLTPFARQLLAAARGTQ